MLTTPPHVVLLDCMAKADDASLALRSVPWHHNDLPADMHMPCGSHTR